jgi:hypothetical protein
MLLDMMICYQDIPCYCKSDIATFCHYQKDWLLFCYYYTTFSCVMLLSFFLLIIPVQLVFTNNGVDGLIYLQLGYLMHFFLGLLSYVYIKRLRLYLTYPTQQGSFQVCLCCQWIQCPIPTPPLLSAKKSQSNVSQFSSQLPSKLSALKWVLIQLSLEERNWFNRKRLWSLYSYFAF